MECNTASAQYKDPLKTSVGSTGEKRVSQWEVLMRKFSEAHKDTCKSVTLDIPRVKRDEKTFPTGSSYTGSWDVLGMSGYGTYKFPNGVIYEGEFDDGTFHGRGELQYPSGAVIYGKWKRGEMVERTLVFPDGLPYKEEDWPYCTMPDRRFTIEIDSGIEPAGQSYLTAEQPTRDIPQGFYDTGDGFYDPEAKIVLSATESSRIIRYFLGNVLKDEKGRITRAQITIETDSGIEPAGQSYLTAEQPTRDIPQGFYDTADGFYDPEAKVLFSATESSRIIRKPSVPEQKWIIENCRTNPMKPLGPRPDLYEEWSKPNQTSEPAETKAFSQQSFGISKSRIRMFIEDRDSETAFSRLRADSTSTSSYSSSSD